MDDMFQWDDDSDCYLCGKCGLVELPLDSPYDHCVECRRTNS